MWRYAGLETYDINNGLGVGVTLFVQGCPRHCLGCHNPKTWDYSGGMEYTREVDKRLFDTLADPNIVRLTISGGEPISPMNLDFVVYVAERFKLYHPQKKLWIYTGQTYESIIKEADDYRYYHLLSLCDILVDGAFEIEKRCLSLPFRGSRNQRIIDMWGTSLGGGVVEYDLV